MGIAVAGIASGIDSDSIISQLLALEEQRIYQIQRRIAIEEQKRAAYDDLSGRLDSLRRSASKFSDDDVFGKLTVTSSDPTVLNASSTSTSAVGSYAVNTASCDHPSHCGTGFRRQLVNGCCGRRRDF